MSTWKVLLATSVIFLTGFFAGILFPRAPRIQWVSPANNTDPNTTGPSTPTNVSAPPPNERRIETLRKLLKDIELSPEQTQRIESHVQESRERTQLMWDLIGPEVKEEFLRLRAEVVQELTPEQRKQFDERVKKNRRAERERASRQNQGLGAGGNLSTANVNSVPGPPAPPLPPDLAPALGAPGLPPPPAIVAPPPVAPKKP